MGGRVGPIPESFLALAWDGQDMVTNTHATEGYTRRALGDVPHLQGYRTYQHAPWKVFPALRPNRLHIALYPRVYCSKSRFEDLRHRYEAVLAAWAGENSYLVLSLRLTAGRYWNIEWKTSTAYDLLWALEDVRIEWEFSLPEGRRRDITRRPLEPAFWGHQLHMTWN